MALTHAGLSAATVQKARVLDVDVRSYTLTVATEYTKKPISGVPFATPYQHFDNGQGIYFMPEVGSLCWLCEPSDGSMPVVLGWTAAQDENDYRAMKVSLNPGDIYLGTRDENSIILRRGGIIQISSTPLCQRLFLPINNTIKDFCENYGLHTLAGDMEWSVSLTPETKDGKRPSKLRLRAKEFANDPEAAAEVEIGSHGDGADAILSMIVRASGAKGAAEKVSLSFGKSGDVIWKVERDVTWTVKGKFGLKVTQDLTLHSDTNATLEGTQQAKVSGGVVQIESKTGQVAVSAAGGMAVSAGAGGAALTVGAGSEPVLLSKTTVAWLLLHQHTSATPGTPTSFPITPFDEASALSKDIMSS